MDKLMRFPFFVCASIAMLFTLVGCGSPQPTEEGPSKIVFVFQKQLDPASIQQKAEQVAAEVSNDIGIPVEIVIPASYSASVQALASNRAHVAYLSAIPYLLANSETPMDILVAEERDNSTEYHSIFVVKADSSYQTLEELRGARMMFTSPTSTSGYVMAWSRLVDEGLVGEKEEASAFFSSVNYAGGYDRALTAVLNGQADVCAVSDYTMEGPKADLYLTAEQRSGLRVLTKTPGVPTHLVAARTDLPAELRQKIKASLLRISAERPELLADVYGAGDFVEVDPTKHIDGAVRALRNTGLDAKNLTQ